MPPGPASRWPRHAALPARSWPRRQRPNGNASGKSDADRALAAARTVALITGRITGRRSFAARRHSGPSVGVRRGAVYAWPDADLSRGTGQVEIMGLSASCTDAEAGSAFV